MNKIHERVMRIDFANRATQTMIKGGILEDED